MGNQVYANDMEIACKAADGKAICSFPDVCMTPPQTPATPPGVPVPYPNTGMASDCTDGSSTVQISGQEVMLKNKSYFKKSTGDEAGSAPMKGLVTHQITGKVYFNAWSMDVEIEGENVVRHLDLTTHNHNPPPGNTAPWTYLDSMAVPPADHPCAAQIQNAQKACGKPPETGPKNCEGTDCEKHMQCILVPKSEDKRLCCSPNNTGHHLIEDHWIKGENELNRGGWYKSARDGGSIALTAEERAAGCATEHDAPTVCANASRSRGTVHRTLHNVQGAHEESHLSGGSRESRPWDYAAGKAAALEAHSETFHNEECHKNGCLEKQLDAFYGPDGSRKLNPPERQALGKDLRPGLLAEYGEDG